jgi:hypothetical protein
LWGFRFGVPVDFYNDNQVDFLADIAANTATMIVELGSERWALFDESPHPLSPAAAKEFALEVLFTLIVNGYNVVHLSNSPLEEPDLDDLEYDAVNLNRDPRYLDLELEENPNDDSHPDVVFWMDGTVFPTLSALQKEEAQLVREGYKGLLVVIEVHSPEGSKWLRKKIGANVPPGYDVHWYSGKTGRSITPIGRYSVRD